MLANTEVLEVLEQAEKLGKMIKESEDYEIYTNHKDQLYNDPEANRLMTDFQQMKADYEDVQRFGRYHPDYSKIMKEIRQLKRELDMHETVASYKQTETQLQMLLDEVSEIVAKSISPNIKAPKDGVALKDTGDGCGCGSGGECGCQAS
ncbi:YlbF family regulator [Alkalibacillus haloalkaliphilus]|uniref:YlbF family regulator n=1 Tax=Alkalibacillus haloalkaliphilus TaxID=94136 RepID=UPI002936C872|nr:YlbF family regulator [Alkalibacillus haloalkaliphilus]MDV2582512.1 YlbF family regulator [Alkalibacillus haloalkaliphilus]